MRRALSVAVGSLPAIGPAQGSEVDGPSRFCGYAPIIDLRRGERVVALEGGVDAGRLRCDGAWGRMHVTGIGWGGRPGARALARRGVAGQIRFAPRRDAGGHAVAIWHGRNGVAWFGSPARSTDAQLAAIDRVHLFEEGEEPAGCMSRMTGTLE